MGIEVGQRRQPLVPRGEAFDDDTFGGGRSSVLGQRRQIPEEVRRRVLAPDPRGRCRDRQKTARQLRYVQGFVFKTSSPTELMRRCTGTVASEKKHEGLLIASRRQTKRGPTNGRIVSSVELTSSTQR